ncbi:MAG: RNA polymerase factor sigma-54 [Rubricoccaceae bacterium]|nr:RNA polymerase factor sigma-54 [Rubricoccaceae bacterium]
MLNLHQKQSLQQKLSPQQIQYIKLLQLPTLALEQRIKAELESNPVLEEGEEEEEEFELDSVDSEADTGDDDESSEEREAEGNAEDEFDWDEFLNAPDDLYGYKAQVDHSAEEEDRDMPMVQTSSMAESLREQVHLLDLSEHEQLIAEQIIGSIDEDGYLRRPIESIIDDIMFNQGTMLTEEDVLSVLKRIQRLDPVGIAARDLRECLLIQLEALPDEVDGRENAIDVVDKAYKAFTMKHFDQIMRKVGIDETELKEAYDLIRSMDPKPGEGEFNAQLNYITPDFTVEVLESDEFNITLNGRNAPELRISRHYKNMWNSLSSDKNSNGSDDKNGETRDFLKQRMESARWFINSINQRRQTMLKVMTALVDIQEEFFRKGEGHLKPMILKDIADVIGMDISTISRVVNGKYVQTEFGVYELKYFFSEGLTTESGEEVSNKEVKAIIDRIIGGEDKSKPLSDQRIADMLADEGFQIARRTVTKYREQLNIPVARLRKQIVLA